MAMSHPSGYHEGSSNSNVTAHPHEALGNLQNQGQVFWSSAKRFRVLLLETA